MTSRPSGMCKKLSSQFVVVRMSMLVRVKETTVLPEDSTVVDLDWYSVTVQLEEVEVCELKPNI